MQQMSIQTTKIGKTIRPKKTKYLKSGTPRLARKINKSHVSQPQYKNLRIPSAQVKTYEHKLKTTKKYAQPSKESSKKGRLL
jgi:hypothetical protein